MAEPRRILLTTFGSLGDLYPYLALAIELQRRGHDPVVGSLEYHRPYIETAGLKFCRIRTALIEEADPELMRRLFHPRKGVKILVRDLVMAGLEAAYQDTLAAARETDLLIAHPLTFATRTVARVLRVPWVSTQLAPIAFLSVFDPPVLPAAAFLSTFRHFGPGFFRHVVALGKWSVRSWTAPYAALNKQLGLTTCRDPFFDDHSPLLELALFSELLGSKQPDWPAQTESTGFAFYDAENGGALPPEIERFLAEGDSPVVFTLGSSAVLTAGRFYEESARAASLLGRRAILLTGRELANRNFPLPEGVAAFDYAPFSSLFPRAAAIVHQGGVGTTAQAMRSGRPMLVIPFAFDQQDNAERVRRLGIARVVKRSAYTARSAARNLNWLLREPEVQLRAAEVGRRISGENGASTACDKLERVLYQ